ncbi:MULTISPECIES: RNA polymerase sigma factor [Roseobacteraceae]|uniref:Putative RNA polymerase sigma factor FecI n=1 Tax=Pseudosulfitobacter pseudonitzschiae TaxID=1402135 RepID=A0A221K874_9RHOB|nr:MULTISPECIES: RNA polymerase sigma factor [Roseobacteraceae]ASM75204.1 putative RNA polymerase sigma factor FecI [Pseudosulfitobacter pseudonitzschiae]
MGSLLDRWVADLFRNHHREMLSRAARITGDRDSGEDVVQSTYVKLVAGVKSDREITNPRAYAITALRSVAFDFTAKRHREWLYRVDREGMDDLASSHDTQAQLEMRERVLLLAVLLNELPRGCATAFLMNKLEGLTHREIAQRMGISTSMVEKHIMRALKHCRNVLHDL